MKTLNELIEELIELQSEGKGEYSVIEAEQGCILTVAIEEDFNEIVFG